MLQRLGQLSAKRPWRSLLVLLVFVVLAGVIGGPVAGRLDGGDGFTPADAESSLATAQLERATGEETSPGVILLVRGDDAAAQAAATELAAVPGVARAEPGPASDDGDSRLVMGTLRAGVDDEAGRDRRASPRSRAATTSSSVAAPSPAPSSARRSPRTSGARSCSRSRCCSCFHCCSSAGGRRCCRSSSGITTVLGTFLVLSVVNLVYGLNVFALNLVIGLGLGLAIDYTLFLVTRFREELANGAEPQAAVRTTMSTAGRTIVFSAATVAAALGTLTLFPLGFAQSMGLAGASVAVVAGIASLLVSPALLALWGHKLARKPSAAADDRWHRIAHAVMRRPGVIAVATAAVMLAVALPALTVNWTPVDASAVPAGKSARVLSDAIAARVRRRRHHARDDGRHRARVRRGRGGGVRRPLRRAGAVPRLEHVGRERRGPGRRRRRAGAHAGG